MQIVQSVSKLQVKMKISPTLVLTRSLVRRCRY